MNTLGNERLRALLRYPSLTELSSRDAVIETGRVLVRTLYLVLPFLAYLFLKEFQTPLVQQNFEPLWPLWWSYAFPIPDDTLVNIVRLGFVISALTGLLFYKKWWSRVIVFIGIWQAQALASSFFLISHQWYVWLYVSFAFIFLPDAIWTERPDAETRRSFLLIIWWGQAIVMLMYSMAGMWKVVAGIDQTIHGMISGFSPHALSYQVASWVPQLQNEALFAPFVIAHPFLVWPAYLLVQYVQVFAVWTLIRPSLQRVWAFELTLFHIGTCLVMGIYFDPFIAILLILFFNSPFTQTPVSLRDVLYDLPLIGYGLRRLNVASQ